ncbi:unnamed protein product [Oreochromis niloticus]|nr:unnamed protein product [Mustela putorius furo]
MNLLLLLILPLTTGCAADGDDEDVLMACKQGWVQFTCKYPETNKRYDHIKVVIPNRTSLQSSLKDVWEDKGRFSLYHDTKHKTLKVGIRDLKQADFGTYRCEFDQNSNRSPVKKELDSGNCQQPFTQTVTRAANIMCDYPDNDFKSWVKFFCRGEDFTCKDILSTKGQNGKFRLTNTNRGFNVSIRDVSSQDAGVYWCGVESDDGSYKASIRQIKLVIEGMPAFRKAYANTLDVDCPTRAQIWPKLHTSTGTHSAGVFELVITVMKCITVLVLLGVSILIFKRENVH